MLPGGSGGAGRLTGRGGAGGSGGRGGPGGPEGWSWSSSLKVSSSCLLTRVLVLARLSGYQPVPGAVIT